MRHIKRFLSLIFLNFIFYLPTHCTQINTGPKLTVVLVIDQCAYHYFPKLKHNFDLGFKKLMEQSVAYTNAYHPHGIPETATGHNAISTGCYPKDHGIVTNQWFDAKGNKTPCELDKSEYAKMIPEFSQNKFGKSGHNTMVDSLTDQFLQFNCEQTPTKSYSISLKHYAAIGMAGKLGKAIWYDDKQGLFVSSKKYFESLPDWVKDFNDKIQELCEKYVWKTAFDMSSLAYDHPFIDNYEFAGASESYINKSHKEFSTLIKTPFANAMLLTLAKLCIKKNLNLKNNDRMLLWVSLSPLDLLTHLFGPNSMESIDMMYHLDRQIDDFINFIENEVGKENCLLAMTADHGVSPIPELLQKQGVQSAKRIVADKLIDDMNQEIKKEFEIEDLVKSFEPNSFKLNCEKLEKVSKKEQKKIKKALVNFLKKYPGIKNAWTYERLTNKDTTNEQFANFYKNQCYPGRIGEIICLPEPYCQVTNYKSGTSHCTPYEYDTRVPLFIYQPGKLQPKVIDEKVLVTQLPSTLAQLLHITKPSASGFNILPGISGF